MVKLFWKAKGPDRAILVTDAMSATGMPDGTYKLGELPVVVQNGKCLYEGVLAGSVLTLDKAVRNFRDFTGAEWSQVIPLASRNPARMTGLDNRIGSLQEGRYADIIVLSPEGQIVATMMNGRVAIARKEIRGIRSSRDARARVRLPADPLPRAQCLLWAELAGCSPSSDRAPWGSSPTRCP